MTCPGGPWPNLVIDIAAPFSDPVIVEDRGTPAASVWLPGPKPWHKLKLYRPALVKGLDDLEHMYRIARETRKQMTITRDGECLIVTSMTPSTELMVDCLVRKSPDPVMCTFEGERRADVDAALATCRSVVFR